MDIVKYLQAQGIGSRKMCRILLQQERILIDGALPSHEITDTSNIKQLMIDGKSLPALPLPYFYILLNKPAGFETSHKPTHYPSVFSLLPTHWQNLSLQAVGRLDADTEGVLLITNDGSLNHFLTSPKHHVIKIYRATLKHAADDDLCHQLTQGVVLRDRNEEESVQAIAAELKNPHLLALSIDSGQYHQVKRMIAACGNRVEYLERIAFASLQTGDLSRGQWRLLQPQEIEALRYNPQQQIK